MTCRLKHSRMDDFSFDGAYGELSHENEINARELRIIMPAKEGETKQQRKSTVLVGSKGQKFYLGLGNERTQYTTVDSINTTAHEKFRCRATTIFRQSNVQHGESIEINSKFQSPAT